MMAAIDRFFNREVVVLITKDYDCNDVERLQELLDERQGAPVRFAQSGTIMNWCNRKGRQNMDVCICYSEDKHLTWCDCQYYLNRGMDIVNINDMLAGCKQPFSEDDFIMVFETG